MEQKHPLEFRGTTFFAVIPLLVLMASTFYFYVIARIDSMMVLPFGILSGLILCSFFAKNISSYWNAVVKGMSDEGANMIALIMLFAGIYSSMMAKANVAGGFVWISELLHLSGAMFCVFTYIAVTVIATSTGTSIGSILTATAIMYPAGVMLGVDNVVMMGAIISGALTGDTIGPVSDTTIAGCITQKYINKHGSADIPGSVFARVKYSLAIAAICIVVFALFGGSGNVVSLEDADALIAAHSYPKGLFMMISVILLLITAVKTRDTYISISVGVISGTIIGIISGIFTPEAILYVKDGNIGGFIVEGIADILETVIFNYGLFGMIGVFNGSGIMYKIIETLKEKSSSGSVIWTELLLMAGTIVSSISMGGDNAPAIMLFGPVANELGQSQKLHPYRRANLLCGFSSTLAFLIPFSSFFIFLSTAAANSVTAQYPFIPEIYPTQLPKAMIFCMASFAVYMFSIFTGWGRTFEGPDGKEVKSL